MKKNILLSLLVLTISISAFAETSDKKYSLGAGTDFGNLRLIPSMELGWYPNDKWTLTSGIIPYYQEPNDFYFGTYIQGKWNFVHIHPANWFSFYVSLASRISFAYNQEPGITYTSNSSDSYPVDEQDDIIYLNSNHYNLSLLSGLELDFVFAQIFSIPMQLGLTYNFLQQASPFVIYNVGLRCRF